MKKQFSFVVLFSLLCLSLFTSCESRKIIVNGLDEKEANEILVFLASREIDAYKVQAATGGGGGNKIVLWNISVPAELANQAMSVLNKQGLPRRRGQNLLDLFSNVGLVPSEMTEKIRYQAGLAEQIASTIRKIDGVLDAEVQISFPEEDPLVPVSERKQDITASIYVKHSGVLDDPNTHLVTKIRRFVTSSITGLKFDNVTVISDKARFTDLPPGAEGAYGKAERKLETIWSIIIAKESISRFRTIFFTFSIIVLLLILAFAWVGWKVFPLIQSHGGLKKLFLSLHPLGTAKKTEEKKEGEQEEEKEKQGEEPSEDEKEEVTEAEEEEEEPPKDVT